MGCKALGQYSLLAGVALAAWLVAGPLNAADILEDARWIWCPAPAAGAAESVECYFRKTFTMGEPEQGSIHITGDDRYTLFVNGQQIGVGENWRRLDEFDITPFLSAGRNVIAVHVVNMHDAAAGLVARIVVKQKGNTHIAYPSDTSWLTHAVKTAHWTMPDFDDKDWSPARDLGSLGEAQPWGDDVQPASQFGRFRTPPDFSVEWVLSPEETGSLIAMTFNEFGQILASREDGPLILATDNNRDGIHESVQEFSNDVRNCQGILALNGDVYAVGEGSQGPGVYRLPDRNRDGQADGVESIVRFKASAKEHGPHAIELGPDGLIYIVVGNHAQLDGSYASASPYHDSYEGDLNRPRYEDPGGHASGLKAPAGTILRTDSTGSFVEVVAGGLRNPYDVGFNRGGDLFTADADMEWDIGAPWYRPTRINLVIPGAEFGWRSGWAKWPEYFFDSLPALKNLGPGSPTGMVFYNHFMYPVRYHNTLFIGDWARGRIWVVRMRASGAAYDVQAVPFVEGRPLNVTDLVVGPDGWLYFCTGGRGTSGGIYRVVWGGTVPPTATDLGTGIEKAIRQPQLRAAWSRQRIARVQHALGDQWQPQLEAIARDTTRDVADRVRALQLMHLLGPSASLPMLLDLTDDEHPAVRAKVVQLMGMEGNEFTSRRLVKLLGDPSPRVRREVCASLVRFQYAAPPEKLIELLKDPDRHVAFAARRALEALPVDQWKGSVLGTKFTRVFLQGAVALLTVQPDPTDARQILERCQRMLAGDVQDPNYPPGYLSDTDFIDLLRVVELAFIRGKMPPEDFSRLSRQLANEYPARDVKMNRELVKLLVFLKDPTVVRRMMEQLESNQPMSEKLHVALLLPRYQDVLTSQHKLQLFAFLEKAREAEGGNSLKGYVDFAAKDLAASLTIRQQESVLAGGAEWPSAALAVLAKLPPNPGKAVLRQVKTLDRRLVGLEGDAIDRLRVGIVAVLGRSRDKQAMLYLRDLYDRQPARREAVAMGLAQQPDGLNWPVLVQALPILDGVAALEVLRSLSEVDRRPEDPEIIRQAILCGLRTKQNGGLVAVKLLEKWTGQRQSAPGDSWEVALSKWQTWFSHTYPHLPKPSLPTDNQDSKWTYAEVLQHLDSDPGRGGDPDRGAAVYQKAQCAKCHTFADTGSRIGPDLTTVSRRFHQKEILQSILFPSHVISDQYASRTVLTSDGHLHTGIQVPSETDKVVLVDSEGQRIEIPRDDVDEIAPSTTSVMPEGLLNELTLEEISDLFAYLNGTRAPEITSRRRVRSAR